MRIFIGIPIKSCPAYSATEKASRLRFALDRTHGFPIHEQQAIRKPGLEQKLTHRNPTSGIQIHPLAVLHHPTANGQLGVNVFSGKGFGGGGMVWFIKDTP